jgi:uncharacterized damage-inducible protein DinB
VDNPRVPSLPPDLVDPFRRFVEGPTHVRAAIEGLDPSRLNRPNQDGWSVRDILMHLADTELAAAFAVRLIIAEEEPALAPYDPALWKRRLHYLFRDPDAALSVYQQVRYSTAELLQQIDRAAWTRPGLRNGATPVTLAELLVQYTDHTEEHVAQIAAMRAQ